MKIRIIPAKTNPLYIHSTPPSHFPQQRKFSTLFSSYPITINYENGSSNHFLYVSTHLHLLHFRHSSSGIIKTKLPSSTDSLCDSIREVHALVSPGTVSDDVLRHISNVETWVCDAMDCVTDCTDGGPDEKKRKFKGTMKRKLLNVEQSISIVLDLFDQYAERCHKP
ncbi:hypothetical protein Tsubulata_025444 [Turnera subulata]|uniref:Pectinesterase inhibitor domain-containing protein n=1 Tax=Turnera subulata TaxID=218843 RepID=A0A9Q0FEE9_9ROSI|nr:hypothetical protein Tsubulata_025444 [Turnera subulata]